MSPQMFSRSDDVRFMNGCSLALNLMCRPQGSALRRPGTRVVAAVKDGANYKAQLFPFSFSPTQSVIVQASRSIVDTREIGHFRFNVDGGTLLYSQPANWLVARPATINSSIWSTGNDAHGLQAGDPVVFTMRPDGNSPTVTFPSVASTADQEFAYTGLFLGRGQQIVFVPDSNGALPPNVEAGRIYWTTDELGAGSTTTYTFSETFQGPNVKGVSTASTGTIRAAAMPWTSFGRMRCNRVYYVSSTNLTGTAYSIAETKGDAISGEVMLIGDRGFGERKGHYAYRRGDLVEGSPAGAPGNFYCMREPWCNAPTPDDHNYCYLLDHIDHDPADLKFWCRLPGTFTSGVTVTPATDTIDFGVAHGLSDNATILLSGSAAPGGTAFDTVYYAIVTGANTIQLSETPSGSALDITSAGTSVDVLANSIYEVPHFYAEAELAEVTTAQSNDVMTIASKDHPLSELRRVSSSRWELQTIRFTAKAAVPEKPFLLEAYSGESDFSLRVTTANELDTIANHTFAVGNPIYIKKSFGNPPVDEGFYIVETVPSVTKLKLKRYNGGSRVTFPITPGLWGLEIMFCESIFDLQSYYKITAVDDNGEESEASEEFEVLNNLLVAGSHTRIGWSAIANAQRYRVYKKQNGLFGFIGETEDLFFTDDNIGPDMSVSPPRVDDRLRKTGFITWDTTNDIVLWPGHELKNLDPVVFHANGNFPTGIEEGATYYAINIGDGSFQLAADPDGEIPATIVNGTPTGEVWAEGGSFPGSVTYFEGRRMFAGSRGLPQDVWATASGTESDLSYSIPVVDSDRIYFRISSREGSSVRHLVPLSQLVLLSNTIEYRLTPLNSDAITPSTISVRPQSYVGSDFPQPAVVNNNVVFAAARGGHVRELGYNSDVLGYLTGDLSIRASHLFDGHRILDIAYQKAPVPTLWFVSSSGKLLSLTYIPEEQIGAWSQHTTDGTFESVAVIPEGNEDAVYVVVLRNGQRYIERFADQFTGQGVAIEDSIFVDSSVSYDGAPTLSIRVPHLASRQVVYLADGISGTGTVDGSGLLTLKAAASKIHVGLGYVSELNTVPLYAQVDQAFGSGMTKNILKVFVRVFQSGAFEAGPLGGRLVPSRSPAVGALQTKLQHVTIAGSWNDEGQLAVRQSDALPLTILGITMEVAFGN